MVYTRKPCSPTETVRAIRARGLSLEKAGDKELRARAGDLRQHATEDPPDHNLIVETFALVCEISHRILGQRPYDVQILGGLSLHEGRIVEMQTGEGKTLAAVAPAVLNALSGEGVHVLTFNDYLARRDAKWMGAIYRFFGMEVGYVREGMSRKERRSAYGADLTYVTAKEAGFDYLRDGLVTEVEQRVHRPLHMALVDEADSILIDEARIPLVIAGWAEPAGWTERAGADNECRARARVLASLVQELEPGIHYVVDHAHRSVHLTEGGIERVQTKLGQDDLYKTSNLELLTELNLFLHAQILMQAEVDYIVRNGRVEIVDEFTGRVVEDRVWPDGLQAAIEVKESLRRSQEGQVLSQITLQHFLKLYSRLCGMTATATVAAEELLEVYGLRLHVIPPHRPSIRKDHKDRIFTNKNAKRMAVIKEVAAVHATGRPILVGTVSVDESEQLAAGLRDARIPCDVLNARRDDREARVVADAGAVGAVTISTNMAGRGTDIRLGGADGADEGRVTSLGGLYVIGTHRHESSRIDDQLRGRAGRQGDPGSSRFFISIEDDLIRENAGTQSVPANRLPDNPMDPVKSAGIRRWIDHVQRIVEGRNADIRRELWSFSQFVEQQRRIFSEKRDAILTGRESSAIVRKRLPRLFENARNLAGTETMIDLERRLHLYSLDCCWEEHLAAIAAIMDGIHLAGVGGLSPLEEFRKAAITSFDQTFEKLEDRVVAKFECLDISENGVDLDSAGLRGPTSTWSYLVDENSSEDRIAAALVGMGNIGFAAGAALTGPVLFLWAIIRGFRLRRRSPY